MKSACLISGTVLGAIFGVVSFLFGLWIVGRVWDHSSASPPAPYALLALSTAGGAVMGGILGRRVADYRRSGIVLNVAATVAVVAVLWFIRHAPP